MKNKKITILNTKNTYLELNFWQEYTKFEIQKITIPFNIKLYFKSINPNINIIIDKNLKKHTKKLVKLILFLFEI